MRSVSARPADSTMQSRREITGMTQEYYQIKDNCRSGLLKYMAEAVSQIPKIHAPIILDIGCGTGVPTIWLAENYGGIITAIDIDNDALEWLHAKIIESKLENQIIPINISFFDLKPKPCSYDIILAEGFLNVIGFEQGFAKAVGMVKEGGYFVIHDEYKDHRVKCEFMRNNHCDLVGTVFLDESVWWNDYYKMLETEIEALNIGQKKSLFKSELKEIENYKRDPSPYKSMYYIPKLSDSLFHCPS
jgi:2-polyprenyl-3-methyl-5-hydroxy-6-metoxy-1,4-benzoquinol methylase